MGWSAVTLMAQGHLLLGALLAIAALVALSDE